MSANYGILVQDRKQMRIKKINVITECGVLLAAAIAFSHFKLYQLPSGGSISIGIIPLLMISARHGAGTGSICGMLMGLLLLMNRPFIVHPLQFLLDYPLAYASLGVAGFFVWDSPLKATSATTLANILRLLFHVIAGAVFFVSNKETTLGAITVSFAYNLSHILPETIICAAIAGYLATKHKILVQRQKI
jgi:thiamine transporter